MDLAGIAAKYAYGAGKAGGIVGFAMARYRPTGPFAPLASVPVATLNGTFDKSKVLDGREPQRRKDPEVLGLFDPTGMMVGDYLVSQADPVLQLQAQQIGTWFVTRLEPARPALCVLCNAVLDVLATESAAQEQAFGYQPPSDPSAATDTLLAGGWPASLLLKTRGDMPPDKLPTDTRAAFYEVLMPAIPGVAVTAGLRLRDGSGAHYHVASAELSAFGNRLLAVIDQA